MGTKLNCALGTALWVTIAALPAHCAVAQQETVVDIASRNQSVRALLLKPAQPAGSVILLAGGHGNLALGKDGKIGWGAGNQLVRTRAAYGKAGFATLVPDIAPDLKQGAGGVAGYRCSQQYARDIGAYVAYMRTIAQPVFLIGTSRAALSVAKAAVELSAGAQRPDAVVITSGMLIHINGAQPSAERNVGRLERVRQPILLIYHEKDGCAYTPAASAAKAKTLFSGAKTVDIVLLKGGSAGSGDPCEARSHHGFQGQDAEVVKTVTEWLRNL
jgi:pimeloyl-ACP methyl ester carboxylesterase